MFGKTRYLHLIGIGGAGMSGIAEVLINLGFRVTGSDLQTTETTQRLEALGANIVYHHRKENVGDADVVVISSAVNSSNPEVMAAEERKIPVIRRAEMLGELMRMKQGIAVAGTHGKTTTTSMVGLVLDQGGLDPTVVVGGKVHSLGGNAVLGTGEYLVAEADEFDRSFLRLTPTIAVVTTLEAEHLDCYTDLDDLKSAFVQFVNKVPFYGAVILCLDEPSLQELIPRVERRLITYGLAPQADLRAQDLSFCGPKSTFVVVARGKKLGEVEIELPGRHNVKNALAAVAVGLELDIPFEGIKEALESFTGVSRRFEIKGEVRGVMVVDDYAHHPTEIEASLQGASAGWHRRVIAVFQPHLYTRTRDFHREFGRSFYNADLLVVTDIYPAREEPLPGVTGELVARAAKDLGHRRVIYIPHKEKILDFLVGVVREGDMVITMGAGDIGEVGKKLLAILRRGDETVRFPSENDQGKNCPR